MPAPPVALIETNLKAALLAQGFVKYTYVEGVQTVVPGELPDEMKPLVKALATGVAQTWQTWQAGQTVLVPVTSVSGTPSTGVLP